MLAALPAACRGFAAAALASLAGRHTALDCRLVESDPGRAISLVVRGEADLAVVHDWHNTPLALPASLSVAELGEDIADVALPAGHPLAGRDVVTPYDLRDERVDRAGVRGHEWLVRCFSGLGIEPDITYQIEEYESQVALPTAGLGVTMLSRLGRGTLPPTVHVVPMQPHRPVDSRSFGVPGPTAGPQFARPRRRRANTVRDRLRPPTGPSSRVNIDPPAVRQRAQAARHLVHRT
ncbi:hypothetical protein GR130_12120 [Streptomyces sp. GS7]|nr:hypothetical protein GR130_12120 [Streptomyces sp. GS7]